MTAGGQVVPWQSNQGERRYDGDCDGDHHGDRHQADHLAFGSDNFLVNHLLKLGSIESFLNSVWSTFRVKRDRRPEVSKSCYTLPTLPVGYYLRKGCYESLERPGCNVIQKRTRVRF